MHNAKVLQDDRRIGELAEDDDQRQVERVSGSVHPKVEIPRPEAGEEMDVGEPTVDLLTINIRNPRKLGRKGLNGSRLIKATEIMTVSMESRPNSSGISSQDSQCCSSAVKSQIC